MEDLDRAPPREPTYTKIYADYLLMFYNRIATSVPFLHGNASPRGGGLHLAATGAAVPLISVVRLAPAGSPIALFVQSLPERRRSFDHL